MNNQRYKSYTKRLFWAEFIRVAGIMLGMFLFWSIALWFVIEVAIPKELERREVVKMEQSNDY